MTTKIDAEWLQDAWHYALAMQGSGDSTFPAETLMERLEAARRVQHMINHLAMVEMGCLTEWDGICPRPDAIRSTEDLERIGRLLQAKVTLEAVKMGIEPRTGDKL